MLCVIYWFFSVFSLCLYLSLTSPLLLKLLFHSCPPLHPNSPFYAISYGISYRIQNTSLYQTLRKKCNFIPGKTRTTGPRWVLEKWKILPMIFFPISIHNWKSQIILLTCPLESKLRHKVSLLAVLVIPSKTWITFLSTHTSHNHRYSLIRSEKLIFCFQYRISLSWHAASGLSSCPHISQLSISSVTFPLFFKAIFNI